MNARTGRQTALILSLVVVTSVLASTMAVGGAVAQEETVSISQDSYTQERGDVFEVTVRMNNTDTAYVEIGSTDAGYHAVVELTDGNEDGVVTMTLNTYYARANPDTGGVGVTASSEAAGDAASTIDVFEPGTPEMEPLAVGTYDLAVGTGYDPSQRSLTDQQDSATLEVVERNTGDISIMTAPGRQIEFNTREEFLNQYNLTTFQSVVFPTENVAKNDFVVVRVNVSGIYGFVQTRNDLTGVGPAGEQTGISLTVESEGMGGMEAGQRVNLMDRNNVLLTDDRNNTMWMVLTTTPELFEPNGVYRATFEINETAPLIVNLTPGFDREVRTNTFLVDERTATIDAPGADGQLQADSDGLVRIGGSTSVAPSTELSVMLRGSGEFSRTQTVTVDRDRRFATSMDVSTVPNNTTVQLSVMDGESTIAESNATLLTEPPTTTTPTTTTSTTTTATTTTTTTTTTQERPTTTTQTTTVQTTTTTSQPTPGLGVLIALIALAIAGLLAYHRRH